MAGELRGSVGLEARDGSARRQQKSRSDEDNQQGENDTAEGHVRYDDRPVTATRQYGDDSAAGPATLSSHIHHAAATSASLD